MVDREELEERLFKQYKVTFLQTRREVIEAEEAEGLDTDEVEYETSKAVQILYDNSPPNFRKWIIRNFGDELHYKKDKYPTSWMDPDKAPKYVTRVINRNPKLIPILNFINNRNRFIRGQVAQDTFDLTFKLCGEKYGDKDHEFAVFRRDKEFCSDIVEYCDCSKSYIVKYLEALERADIIFPVGRRGNTWVFTDGYYVRNDKYLDRVTYRKVCFLTGNSKNRLKNFCINWNKSRKY